MAWIRLMRAGGAVSGGVNCSLRSGRGTAETTTQITVTRLAQSLSKTTRVLQHWQGRSWRHRACIMWVYIKSKRRTIKCDEEDFSIRFAISSPVLHKYCSDHSFYGNISCLQSILFIIKHLYRAGEKEKKTVRGGSHFPPSLSPLSLFAFSFLSSPLFCSVFRFSSLREWSTIKDLIKTPEQAKAPWQRARLGLAQTGKRAVPGIEWGWGGWGRRDGGNDGSREGLAWSGLGSRFLFLAQFG